MQVPTILRIPIKYRVILSKCYRSAGLSWKIRKAEAVVQGIWVELVFQVYDMACSTDIFTSGSLAVEDG